MILYSKKKLSNKKQHAQVILTYENTFFITLFLRHKASQQQQPNPQEFVQTHLNFNRKN